MHNKLKPWDWLRLRFPDFKIKGHNFCVSICPFCGNTSYNCEVTIDKGYHCWSCSAHGSFLTFVKELEGVSYAEAKSIVHVPKRAKPLLSEIEEPEITEDSPDVITNYHDWPVLARRYADSRGWRKIQERYKLGYCKFGRFKGRIIFPYYENDGDKKPAYWQGRTIYREKEPRWLFPKTHSRARLFNYEAYKDKCRDYAVIVEGPADAVAVDGIALGGVHMTGEKLRMLLDLEVKRFYVWLDADAVLKSWAIAKPLAARGFEVFVYTNLINKDASESQGVELPRMLEHAVRYSDSERLKWCAKYTDYQNKKHGLSTLKRVLL